MLVEFLVDGSTDECHILAVAIQLLHMLHTLTACNGTGNEDAGWLSLGLESLQRQLHALASGQHGIHQHECLAREVGSSDILNVHIHLAALLVLVIAVCAHKGILGLVKYIQKALVHRQSCAEHSGHHHLVVKGVGCSHSQRSLHLLLRVVEHAAQLVSLCFANALQIAAEAHAVGLHIHVSQLGNVGVHHTARVSHVYSFHSYLFLLKG